MRGMFSFGGSVYVGCCGFSVTLVGMLSFCCSGVVLYV